LRKLAGTVGRRSSAGLKRAVGLGISVTDAVMAAVEMRLSAQDTSQRTQAIAATAEQLVHSVEVIAANTASVAEETGDVRKVMAEGDRTAGNAVDTMHGVSQAVGIAAARVDTLAKASEEIGSIIETIEEIAFHTNMLALNASVEAARAGEAGKGFAVVAEEVRRLADQTKNATVDIRQRVGKLHTDMAAIVRSIRAVGDVVSQGLEAIEQTGTTIRSISEKIDHVTIRTQYVANVVLEQKQGITRVAEDITAIALMTDEVADQIEQMLAIMDLAESSLTEQMDSHMVETLPNLVLHRAKSDHAFWKRRLANMMCGRVALESGELADHHQCRLGKWYDQVNDEALLSHPAYRKLLEPHRLVHLHGKRAVDLFNDGDLEGAVDELAQVAEASDQVLKLLNTLTG
jgi:methyl-accepting chemotaxis protein